MNLDISRLKKSKTDPQVAEALIKQFDPSIIFVIGDSNTEAQLAESLRADTFIFCGLDRGQITDGKTLPHMEQHVTGYPMIRYIEERLKKEMPHILMSGKAQRRQKLYRDLKADYER